MANAQYVNKFNVSANSAAQEVFISMFQDQPIWDDTVKAVTGVENIEVGKIFMSVVTARALINVLTTCIADSENKQTARKE